MTPPPAQPPTSSLVYVSYTWEAESERMVDELERAFEARGIPILRDKKAMEYKDSIRAFEEAIGRGQCIVLVISDRYLRSEHCMHELLEIEKNQQMRARIFPVVLQDAKIYRAVDRLRYIQHWDAQIAELNQAIRQVEVVANLGNITADLDLYTRIRASFDRLGGLLSDMNALTPEIHAASGFSALIRSLENTLRPVMGAPAASPAPIPGVGRPESGGGLPPQSTSGGDPAGMGPAAQVTPILGHHFLCYSAVDGEEAAEQLYQGLCAAGLPAWLDQHDAREDLDFDLQVEEALRGCASLVLVLTADSAGSADARREWRRALQYKKPLLLARFTPGVEPPLTLSNRSSIECGGEPAAALERLRQHLEWRATPPGILRTLEERLADAQRDLRPARGQERARILAEIELLQKQIREQEQIVKDPQAAARRTQATIDSGLERERQPEKPEAGRGRVRFINPPPGTAPDYFQDRVVETQLVGQFIQDPALRMLTVVGRAGIGKTALVCRLLQALENGRLPDEGGPLRVDGIVYLSAVGSRRIQLANLYADLGKLLSAAEAKELEERYRDPKISPGEKMRALLAHFPPTTEDGHEASPVVALLDNFEDLVDAETQELKDEELAEGLAALLEAPAHRVKVLVTTRQACRSLLLRQPGRQEKLELDSGLESPFAENILRAMDRDGKVGLRDAPAALLGLARERTRGYPRALEALYGILSADRYTTLEEVLAGAEGLLPEHVVAVLVGQAYSRLDPAAQQVLQALAVYARPVSPAGVDYLLQPYGPALDSAAALNRLVSMHFARREAGKYYLHPVDRAYAFARIPQGEENEYHRRALLHRAAEYYAQARLPREEWKRREDLEAQLAEIELRCAAGEYDSAGWVLREIGFNYLLLWGHTRLLIELHERLQDHLSDRDVRMNSLNMLGAAYYTTGQAQGAIACYERGLVLAREVQDRSWEGAYLGNLGNAYADLGQTERAIGYYEQALAIDRDTGDRRGEGADLGNLGVAYSDLGQMERAIGYYEQSLEVAREIGDRQGEGTALGTLGSAYSFLGQTERAIGYQEQALAIAHEIGDRLGEGVYLGNLGNRYSDLGQTERAIGCYEQALAVRREIGDQYGGIG